MFTSYFLTYGHYNDYLSKLQRKPNVSVPSSTTDLKKTDVRYVVHSPFISTIFLSFLEVLNINNSTLTL